MKLLRKPGVTSQIWQVFIRDSSSSSGAGLTGLTNASSGLTAYYHRDTDTTATAISLVTMTVGTFTSSGFKEIDATNMPGWYQFCPPNAALAAGANSCVFMLKGATNMVPLPIEVDLDGQVDVALWNGTAVSTPATAGIPDVNVKNVNNVSASSVTTVSANLGTTQPVNFSGTGASAYVKGDLEQWVGTAPLALSSQQVQAIVPDTQKVDVNTVKTNPVVNAGTITFPTNATLASTTNITGGTITTVSGNVNGSVGSVTGNVGGNVVGSVGSISGVTFPANFSTLAIASVTGAVTVGTNNDKGGYSISGTKTTLDSLNDISAAGVRGAVGLAAANLDSQLGALDADVLSRASATVTPGWYTTNVTVSDKTGFKLASDGVDQVVVETGINLRQAMSPVLSAAGGVLGGATTTTVSIAAANHPTTNRITATVDADGNRTAVTLNLPA